MFRLTAAQSACLTAGLAALTAATLLGAGGCQQPDLAQRRLTLRCARLQRTVDVAAEHERQSARRLERTLDVIGQAIDQDAQASRANIGELQQYWDAVWQRWIDRQPAYKTEANRFLGGNPEHIERNAIILLF